MFHNSTGFAPNQVLFNRILPSSSDRLLNIVLPVLEKSHEDVSQEISKKLTQVKQNQKKSYDQNLNFKKSLK